LNRELHMKEDGEMRMIVSRGKLWVSLFGAMTGLARVREYIPTAYRSSSGKAG